MQLILKRTLMVLASSGLTLTLLIAGLIWEAGRMGIVDPGFRHENEVGMWLPDTEMGYRNTPGYSGACAGTVILETNLRGFRGKTENTPEPRANVRRVVGMGDSVTWGIGVNERETFLSQLEQSMNDEGRWEVLNAGVVGYSTWQEARFLEKMVLPLRPDVVFVNYCENDLIPTEDPFDLTQRLYLNDLHDLAGQALPETDRDRVNQIAAMIRAPRFKRAYDSASTELQDATWELLVERPMRQMAQKARSQNVRLVYLFIPMATDSKDWARRTQRWQQVLTEEGAEWLDLSEMIRNRHPRVLTPATATKHMQVRVPFLDPILRHRRTEAWQDSELYLDIMHPTRLGHKLIAGELQRFLEGKPMSTGVAFRRLDPGATLPNRQHTMRTTDLPSRS